MPELPEVETVRRTIERVLKGQRIVDAEVVPDEIVLQGREPEEVRAVVQGQVVTGAGRKGKYWWIELNERPWLFGHLGMAGWLREYGADTIRLREHGQAPLDDETGRPRFLKLRLRGEDGREIVMTDGRRLARLWLAESPEADPRVSQLGPDTWLELPDNSDLHKMLIKRKAPAKALLLDQKLFAGVGNWIADEVLYHSGIAPSRTGESLTVQEVSRLRDALKMVLDLAVEVGADASQYPKSWLFHYRWGGKGGDEEIEGHPIIRETIGSRTTAWVPSKQK
ncbi:DNA-formamidopyrimidine glycosylase family protein [Kamptonema cortianum]|nr:DNA-formamidopyrimidine glycosylase family protein [Kamptonema cortianum]